MFACYVFDDPQGKDVFNDSESIKNVFLFLFISLFLSFGVCRKIQYFLETSSFKQKISTRVDQKKIKCPFKEYVSSTNFKF